MTGTRPTVYVVAVNPRDLELSFIRPHIERLAADTVAVHGFMPAIGATPVLSQAPWARVFRKAVRALRGLPWEDEIAAGYTRAFRRRPAVVLAEFGPSEMRLL